MGKWYGTIGYAELIETKPGVWKDKITERKHYGEILQYSRRLQSSGEVNDDLNLVNEISIVADPFAQQNFHAMKYIGFMGAKWKITNVKVQYPRLILSVGGVYNGK